MDDLLSDLKFQIALGVGLLIVIAVLAILGRKWPRTLFCSGAALCALLLGGCVWLAADLMKESHGWEFLFVLFLAAVGFGVVILSLHLGAVGLVLAANARKEEARYFAWTAGAVGYFLPTLALLIEIARIGFTP